jgi:hypothetical protein
VDPAIRHVPPHTSVPTAIAVHRARRILMVSLLTNLIATVVLKYKHLLRKKDLRRYYDMNNRCQLLIGDAVKGDV